MCQVVYRRHFSFEEGAARVILLNEKLESLSKGEEGMFFLDTYVSLEQYLGRFPSGWGTFLWGFTSQMASSARHQMSLLL